MLIIFILPGNLKQQIKEENLTLLLPDFIEFITFEFWCVFICFHKIFVYYHIGHAV